MRRAPAIVLGVGAAALLLALLLAYAANVTMMPSYLAAWLFWAALPIGALPLLMALELVGGAWSLDILRALRRLVLLVPVAAILIVPVLLRLHGLYPWSRGVASHGAAGGSWLGSTWFIVRAIVYLVIWTALALIFARAAAPERRGRRRMAAALGLAVHLVIATLAAVDWTMSLDPRWSSSMFGLLLISVQCCIALSVAVLIAGAEADAQTGLPQPGALLLVIGSIWLYLQFMQFLTMWSADKPDEVLWYLQRDADGGRFVEWVVFLAGFLVPLCLLVFASLRKSLSVVALVALLMLFAHALEMLWLVTPVFRRHFSLRGSDILALVGVGGIAVGAALLMRPRPVTQRPVARRPEAQHG